MPNYSAIRKTVGQNLNIILAKSDDLPVEIIYLSMTDFLELDKVSIMAFASHE